MLILKMQTNINYCVVKHCRYKFTHTTRGHICGICGINGHGQIECFYADEINQLKNNNFDDILKPEDICTIEGCNTKLFHSLSAHHCSLCNGRGHDLSSCPKKIITILCPICRTSNDISANQKKIKGLTDKCSICFDKNVEIFFPNCAHVCVCYECFVQTSRHS